MYVRARKHIYIDMIQREKYNNNLTKQKKEKQSADEKTQKLTWESVLVWRADPFAD